MQHPGLAIFLISMVIMRKVDVALTMMIQTITTNPAYGILFVIFMVPAPYKSVCIAVVMSYFFTIIVITILTSFLRLIIRRREERVEFTKNKKKPPIETISSSGMSKIELKNVKPASNAFIGTMVEKKQNDFPQAQL